MWIEFKYDIENKQIITKKVNLDNIESVNFFKDKIELIPPMRFESDFCMYVIDEELNQNFEDIKEILRNI